MKECFSLVAFSLFLSLGLNAQIGFTVAPTQGLAEEWQVLVENYLTGRKTDFLKHGNTAVLEYTFQLPAPEWQYVPAVHAMRTHFIHWEHDFEIYMVGLQSNFNFTPFKAAQTAEMPNARIYFQLSPGIDLVRMRYAKRLPEKMQFETQLKEQKLSLNGGIIVAIEWQLTQLLTITPVAGIRYFPNLSWDGFSVAISEDEFQNEYDEVNWRHLTLGMRIGFNLHAPKEMQQ